MPALTPYTDNMFQEATYWPPGVNDGFGGVTFGAPVLIMCRWQDNAVLFRDFQGREETSSAIVYPSQPLEVRGYLALGDFTGGVPSLETMLALDSMMFVHPTLGHLWQDPNGNAPVTVTGQTVKRLHDHSRHEYILSVAGPGPVYRNLGGLEWLEFVSPHSLSVLFGASFSQPIHRFTAIQFDTWSAGSVLIQGGPGSDISLSMFGIDGLSMNGIVGASGVTSGVGHVIEEIYNGANSQLIVDGVILATGSIIGPVHDRYGLVAGPTMRVFGGFEFEAIQANADVDNVYAYLRSLMGLETGLVLDPQSLGASAFEIRQCQQSPSLDATRVLHKVFL